MVKLLSSSFARQPVTAFERGILACVLLVVAIAAVTILYVWMKAKKEEINHAKQAVLREDCKVIRGAINEYTADTGNPPGSLDDVIVAGYLKTLPAGFSLEACR
jgi:general secretion pathway protein G